MKPVSKCERCGTNLQGDSPKGLCPACLIHLALDEQTVPATVNQSGEKTGAFTGVKLKYFGDYELQAKVAEGGMGVVYKGRQVSLNRTVAVKMILTGQLATKTEVQRFLTEAEAAANLQHPNIVAIHEIGQFQEQHYYSMDYIDGPNLAEFIRQNEISPLKAAELLKTISQAVHFAHQRGILHRDLKPSNILMDAEGQPRITDFGLARRLEQPSDLTQSGAIMGSPSYMAPEQASGKPGLIGPSTDIYSLGAMLYQLLTGRAPFVGESPIEIMRRVVQDQPEAPSKLKDNIPSDLETICLKCLEKNASQRYATAQQLVEELERFLNHQPILAKPASLMRKAWSAAAHRPWAIVGAGALVLTLALAFSYGLWEQVKFLEWRNANPQLAQLPKAAIDEIGNLIGLFSTSIAMAGFWGLAAGSFYYALLKSRRKARKRISPLQLGSLAVAGVVLIGLGLILNIKGIRIFIWSKAIPSYLLFGLVLGSPFLFCWFGGIFLMQAWRWHQVSWTGEATPDELFPAPRLRSNPVAFAIVMVLNMGFFLGLSYLAVPEGLYPTISLPSHKAVDYQQELAKVAHATVPYGLAGEPDRQELRPLHGFLRISFFLVALGFSFAPRLFSARRVLPAPISIFYWIFLIAGGALVQFYFLPLNAYLMAILAGLLGGWLLLKAARIGVDNNHDSSPPASLRELIQFDGKAFALSLIATVSALILIGGLVLNWNSDDMVHFVLIGIGHAFWPIFVLATRAARGPLRNGFLFLVPIFVLATAYPLGGITAGSNVAKLLAYAMPVGLAAGFSMMFIARVRVKTAAV